MNEECAVHHDCGVCERSGSYGDVRRFFFSLAKTGGAGVVPGMILFCFFSLSQVSK